MAAPFIPVPIYPLVPNVAGVPPLARASADVNLPTLLAAAVTGNVPPILNGMLSGAVPSMLNGLTAGDLPSLGFGALLSDLSGSSILSGDDPSLFSLFSGPQWGIFDSGNSPVIVPDNVIAFEYTTEYRIANYPVEEGGFQSYNKVVVPFEVRVTMSKGGTSSDRTEFIQSIESAKATLDIYSVVTPEFTYPSVNIIHVDYDRKADNGAALIKADIHLQQVNVTATATYSNTAQPSGANQTNDGSVQTAAPTSGQKAAALDGPS